MPLLRNGFAALLFIFCSVSVCSKEKNPKTYPEHGTVLAMHDSLHSYTNGVYTDSYGKSHGGNSTTIRKHVYRVETTTRLYELEGKKKDQLEIGGVIDFRIEKDRAYIQRGEKEEKFRIVGVELTPSK
jgi:hypothetical protein